MDHVSRGGEQFHNSRVLKKQPHVHLHYSLFKDLYHVPFDRLDLISSICIILQYVFISESPPKNFYSYLNNRLIVQELDIYCSHFTEQFY